VASELDYTMSIFFNNCPTSHLNVNKKAKKGVLKISRNSVVHLEKWILQKSAIAFSAKISNTTNINYALYYLLNHTRLRSQDAMLYV